MSRTKKALLILLVLFIVIQFFRPARNQAAGAPSADITTVYKMPDGVHAILKNSCYDCHSNQTEYPWYAQIQPVRWWLESHIKEGKQELNFNEFGNYTTRRQLSKLKAISGTVEDGKMPLSSYTLVHTKARLSKAEKVKVMAWANDMRDSLSKNR
jgi:hypothetical protein